MRNLERDLIIETLVLMTIGIVAASAGWWMLGQVGEERLRKRAEWKARSAEIKRTLERERDEAGVQ